MAESRSAKSGDLHRRTLEVVYAVVPQSQIGRGKILSGQVGVGKREKRVIILLSKLPLETCFKSSLDIVLKI